MMIQPFPKEDEETFIQRAHYSLLQSVPEPMDRNQMVWDAWDNARGNAARQRAEQHFPVEQYNHRENVCLWHEHESEVLGPDGIPQVRKNDVERIKAIIRENNARIADQDSYAAIVDKHTLPPGANDKGKERPKTLGFAGPFRLGMIGRIKPKFAIFGDEHHRKDRGEVLKDRPRRSVEVLTLKTNGRSYIDPIAALSEAPRLPLPVQFSATESGEEIERYTGEAVAAFPGGGNTFIPGASTGKRNRKQVETFDADGGFSETNTPQTPVGQPMDANVIQQFLAALESTPQWAFLTQQMQQGSGEPAMQGADPMAGGMPGAEGAPADVEGAPGGAPPMPGQPAPTDPYRGGAMPMPQPMGSQIPAQGYGTMPQRYGGHMPAQGYGMMPQRYGGHMPAQGYGTVPQRYSVVDDDADSLKFEDKFIESENEVEEEMEQERYEALEQSNRAMMQQMADLRMQNAALAANAADAQRRERINEFYQAHPHMVESVQAECERWLYSAGSTESDDAFEAYYDQAEEFARRASGPGGMIPTGEMPSQPNNSRYADPVQQARYEAQIQAKSVEIYEAHAEAGSVLTPEQAWELAENEVG